MKKFIVATLVAVSMLMTISASAWANLYSIRAENGKIMHPTGLSLDASAILSREDDYKLNDYRAEVGYGIFPAITVSGAFEERGDEDRFLAKAYLSPTNGEEGYTLYAGYDVTDSQVAMYGASLWLDYKYLYAFLNIESDIHQGERQTQVTPGFNFRLTPKIRILGEAALDANDLSAEELRAGIQYNFASKIAGKFVVLEQFDDDSDRVFQTGLSIEI